MAIMYNNQNVDESYSDKLEANLYYGSVLVPGVTCDDSFVRGPGGGIYVHKLATGTATPNKPGKDFTDEETTDDLIQIVMNNCFQKSKKIYNVQAAACGADLKDANLAAAQAEVREGWCLSGLACLVQEGTVNTSTASTVDTCIEKVIAARQAVVEKKGTSDVVMCSPAFYAMVLNRAGKEFQPSTNDRIRSSGNVGTYLGMNWIEANGMVSTAAKYYDHAGTLKTVNLSQVEFILYNHETLSVISNIDMARLVDSEMFNGCKAQVEQNTGYRVRNANLAYVAKKAAS